MLKKIIKILLKTVVFLLVYILQLYVINNTTLFGVNGNLLLMSVVIITLTQTNLVSYITALAYGLLSDILFYTVPCKYIVIYLLTVSVLISLKKIYNQDSKLAIIIFSTIGTLINGIILYIFNLMNGISVNIFSFFVLLLKESIINICLAFIMYLIFKLCSKEG